MPAINIAAGAFGIAAAFLLAGGFILLRFQRERHQFRLLQAALEKGITSLPGAPPAWLLSLRQGVLTLVLGIGLILTGIALHVAAKHVAESVATQSEAPPPPPPPARPNAGPDDRPPPAPPRDNALDRWHRIETQRLAGVLAGSAGLILVLLGLTRIVFARTERKYTPQPPL